MALTKQNNKPAVKQSFDSPTDTTTTTTNANNTNNRQIKVNNCISLNQTSNNNNNDMNLHQRLQQQKNPLAESHQQQRKQKTEETSVKSEDQSDERKQQQQDQKQQQQPVDDEISLVRKLIFDCLLYFIKAIIFVYSLISQPYYYFKHEVYKKQYEVDQVERSKQLDPTDPNSPWVQTNIEPNQRDIEAQIDTFTTYDEMMLKSFMEHADSPCYGFRQVIHEQWTKRPDSDKLFRQVKLSDFKWVTCAQFNRQIEAARRGFLLEGVRAGDTVMLYADTRPEWQISSQALIRLGAIVGTMYSTLGVDGIVHSVNETQVTHVVTQRDKVNKLLRLKSKLPKLRRIIYFEPVMELKPEFMDEAVQMTGKKDAGQQHYDEVEAEFEHKEVACMPFGQLLMKGLRANDVEIDRLASEWRRHDVDRDDIETEIGSDKNDKTTTTTRAAAAAAAAGGLIQTGGRSARTKDSIAVIMYTSGSTGIPKGVLISHRNIMATIKSFSYVTKDFVCYPKENVCTAYLPCAHIFEFCIESVMLYHGVRFGFATPHTLTDKSPGLMPGQVGDLTLLKPTVMIIVPLILDRIVQGVKQALKGQSYFKANLVGYLIDYKIRWQKRHYETPLVNKIVCSKVSMALGGRAKYVICGSAPLSGETQSFVRASFNLKLPQGFGTTETCAATACQLFEDQSTNNVGLPVSGAQIKLEPWFEGNYRPTDKPHPRGEIVVGGEMIAHGYFNLDEQTREAFYLDDEGTRWYRTGDIGEFLPNGNLKIIDRKKDLVKLQNGEYVSLGKIESTLKSNPYTDNFCVYANSNHNYVVALGPANELAIRTLAQQIVDEYARNSPSMLARNQDRGLSKKMSEQEQQVAIGSLKEVLALYEQDQINNNDDQQQQQPPVNEQLERKMSSLSTNSNSPGQCINERLQQLCENGLLQDRVLAYVKQLAEERALMTLEIPKKVLLLAEEWTEDKNLVTAAMKIRRNFIYKRYERELKQVYAN